MGIYANSLLSFFYQIQPVVFHLVEDRRDRYLGIAQSEPLCFAEEEVGFVSYLELGRILHKVFFCASPVPACDLDEALYECIFAVQEVDHAAVVVADQGYVA